MRTAAPVRRGTQQGYAEGLVPLITLMVYGLIGLMLIAFVASIAAPAAWLKGRWRLAVLVVVVGFWGHLYWQKVAQPKARVEWMLAARARCDAERKQIPPLPAVEGFLDEGAALHKHVLWQLFAERHLEFIEIAIPPSGAAAGRIAYPDGDGEEAWVLPTSKGAYVRLQLGKKGDPDCVELPRGLAGRMDSPPFLPDTCVTARYSNAPTARYALSLRPVASPASRRDGAWAFIDRTTGVALMTLTTSDSPQGFIGAGGYLSRPGGPHVSDCSTPHTIIVDRLAGPVNVRPTQLLTDEQVMAQPEVASIDRSDPAIPRVQAVSQTILFNDAEEQALFSLDGRAKWELAIERAAQVGDADFGRQLVDLRAGRLVSLRPTSRESSYPWEVFAVSGSFLVISSTPSWDRAPANLLASYSRDGSLQWRANVVTPEPRERRCTAWWPRAAYVTATDLVLATRCAKLSPDEWRATHKDGRGELWKIPLSALPGKRDAPATPP